MLRVSAAGLDLSDEYIKIVDFSGARGQLRLTRHGEEKIPLGVVENGKILKPADLVQSLTRIREKHGITNIIAALPEEDAYVVKLRIPAMKRKNLREAIELQLEEFVPLKPSEAEFDYHVLREPTQDHPFFDCKVSVLPQVSVQSYLDAFTQAGLRPLAFEIEGQALARAVIPEHDPAPLMIVDFGKWRTGIAIVVDHHLRFSATVPFGGSHLNKQIMEKFQVSEDQAEAMKREQKQVPAAQAEEFTSLVIASLAVLADEVNKYKLYWLDHKDETGDSRPKLEGLYLCGGSSNIEGMCAKLQEAVGLPAQTANPWINAFSLKDHIPALPANDALRYATAIGLALRTHYL